MNAVMKSSTVSLALLSFTISFLQIGMLDEGGKMHCRERLVMHRSTERAYTLRLTRSDPNACHYIVEKSGQENE